MSRGSANDGYRRRGFPRASGDEPAAYAVAAGDVTFSPRERG